MGQIAPSRAQIEQQGREGNAQGSGDMLINAGIGRRSRHLLFGHIGKLQGRQSRQLQRANRPGGKQEKDDQTKGRLLINPDEGGNEQAKTKATEDQNGAKAKALHHPSGDGFNADIAKCMRQDQDARFKGRETQPNLQKQRQHKDGHSNGHAKQRATLKGRGGKGRDAERREINQRLINAPIMPHR